MNLSKNITLKMKLAAGGGQAISLFAASEDEIDDLPQYSEM